MDNRNSGYTPKCNGLQSILWVTEGSHVDFEKWICISYLLLCLCPEHTIPSSTPPLHHLSVSVPLCQSPCSRALEIFQTYLGNQSYSKLKENIECHWAISMKPVRGGAESWACGELGLPVSQWEASSAGPPASSHTHAHAHMHIHTHRHTHTSDREN